MVQRAGAGEIVLNSIDRDGLLQGYDLKLAQSLIGKVTIPITFLGGVGSIDHIKSLVSIYGIIGCAVGSMFVFKGPYRAVLISYPSQNVRDKIADEINSNRDVS